MTTINATATASSNGWVLSLTMTFMPRIDETAVTGSVMAGRACLRPSYSTGAAVALASISGPDRSNPVNLFTRWG
jgi:hypothetical protein